MFRKRPNSGREPRRNGLGGIRESGPRPIEGQRLVPARCSRALAPTWVQRPPPPGLYSGGARVRPCAQLTSQSSSYLTLSVIFHNMASGVPQNSRQLNPGSPHPPSGKSKMGVTVARRLPPPPPREGLAVRVTGRASAALRA